jgi:hypothetical protein
MGWDEPHQVVSKHISTKASMGGLGSGGSNRKGGYTVGDCLKLSIAFLKSAGALTKGKRGVVNWGPQDIQFETIGDDLIALRWNEGKNHQAIGFQWLAHKRALGGHQIYLVCPTCFMPRAALFFHQNQFRCRVCHRLPYPSQRERTPDRLRRKLEKLAKRLGSCYQWGESAVPQRPQWMRLRTYCALANKYRHLLREYEEEISIVVARVLANRSRSGAGR